VWDNPEQTILRYDIEGQWSWDELNRASDEIYAHMDGAAENYIGAIIYFIGKVHVPSNALVRVQNNNNRNHEKAGLTVMVGANFLIRGLFSTFASAYRLSGRDIHFEYANTLEDARQLIAQHREQNQK
jgi:hypothetical protein